MSEKNLILNNWANRHSVMPTARKPIENPIIRSFLHQLELISKTIDKWMTP